MTDMAGPTGFQFIETAPRDGTFIRLRFRRDPREEIGQWQRHTEMPAGGSWFDEQGGYITPGPIYWCARASSAKGEG